MIYKVYQMQKLKPCNNDWIHQVIKDKKDLNIDLDDNEIQLISKYKFKQIVEKKLHVHVKEYLDQQKNVHTKSKLMPRYTGKPEGYLFSNKLNKEEIQNLFKYKTRIINVYDNFKNDYTKEKFCKLCHIFPNTQEHIIKCEILKQSLSDQINFLYTSVNNINGTIEEQENFAKSLTILLKKREDLLVITPNGDQCTDVGGSPHPAAACS